MDKISLCDMNEDLFYLFHVSNPRFPLLVALKLFKYTTILALKWCKKCVRFKIPRISSNKIANRCNNH